MADEISDLRLFARIVAAGSLSETARRLNSSLPAVSRRLAAMEARLGVRLIERGPRRFTPTQEGDLLYARAVAILADLDEVEAEVSAKVKAPRGHLRVGAHLEIGRRRVAPLVASFTAAYPGISIELVLTDSRMDVLADDLDVALQVDVPSDGSVISKRIFASRRVACASPDYIARRGMPAAPADLLRHDCIRLVRGQHVFDRWTFEENGEHREIQVRGSLSTNNSEVMHSWALAGRGVALKALWDIEEDLQAGRLVEFLAPFACNEISLYATYASRVHLPPRVRLFLDFIAPGLKGSEAMG